MQHKTSFVALLNPLYRESFPCLNTQLWNRMARRRKNDWRKTSTKIGFCLLGARMEIFRKGVLLLGMKPSRRGQKHPRVECLQEGICFLFWEILHQQVYIAFTFFHRKIFSSLSELSLESTESCNLCCSTKQKILEIKFPCNERVLGLGFVR